MSGTATRYPDHIPALVPTFAIQRGLRKRHEAAEIRGRTYRVGGIGRLNLKLVHRGGNCLRALEEVRVYCFTICDLGVV